MLRDARDSAIFRAARDAGTVVLTKDADSVRRVAAATRAPGSTSAPSAVVSAWTESGHEAGGAHVLQPSTAG